MVRVDEPAARDLELAHELEVAALGDVEHLARVHQPPHGHGAVVLDDRLDVLDRPHVHGRTSTRYRKLTPPSALSGGATRSAATSDDRTHRAALEPRRRESFAPFGVIPPDEGDGNPTADLEFTRDDGWVNFIGHTLDEIEVRRRAAALRAAQPPRHAHADADADERRRARGGRAGRGRLLRARALRHGAGVRAAAATRVCTCTAARGTGARIPSAPSTCASSTSRAAAGRPTTAIVELARDHGVVYEVTRLTEVAAS